MKSIVMIIFSLVLLISCSNDITKPDFEDLVRVTSEHYANAFPNPNNGFFSISFYLLQNAHIQIVILNSQNEIIRHLADDDYEPANYYFSWDCKDDDDNVVCSGIYYVKFNVNGFLFREGMCFLK